MDWAKTPAKRDENHLSFVIWCDLHYRFYATLNFPLHTYPVSEMRAVIFDACIQHKAQMILPFTGPSHCDDKWWNAIMVWSHHSILAWLYLCWPAMLTSRRWYCIKYGNDDKDKTCIKRWTQKKLWPQNDWPSCTIFWKRFTDGGLVT